MDQAYATARDEGLYVCSQRTWWRIAATLGQALRPAGPRHQNRRRPDRPAPQLLATGPNQVWSWDITDFKGPYSRQVFKVYSVIDIYSRQIVAHRVEDREADALAVQMFAAAFAAAGTAPDYVHADNGAAMRSNAIAGLQSTRNCVDAHVVWHNTTHRHSGIALFTPNQLHDATWVKAHHRRQGAQQDCYRAHPER